MLCPKLLNKLRMYSTLFLCLILNGMTLIQSQTAELPWPCNLPVDVGSCTKAVFLRYYYDSQTGECERFVYGGCGGNGNNFGTKRACQRLCDSTSRLADVPVVQAEEEIPKELKKCFLLPDPGPCKAYMRRYYYNHPLGECKEFGYGGCRGNLNRFETFEECQQACGKRVTPDVLDSAGPCFQSKDPGPCRAAIPRYYYQHWSGKCQLFTYGGCRGNGNNFKSEEACHSTCDKSLSPITNGPVHPVCHLPRVTGPCRARIRRYYYNPRTGRCEAFIYGGCQGNLNNFRTLYQCMRMCVKQVPVN